MRRVAHEPRVREVVGGARLARGRAADVRGRAGARLDVLLEDLGDRVRRPVRYHALALRLAEVVRLAVGEHDLPDRLRLAADPAGGERRVGGRHLERRDAVGETAEPL